MSDTLPPLGPLSRAWLDSFMAELLAAACDEVEIREAVALLGQPSMECTTIPRDRWSELTDEQRLALMSAIGEHSIKRVLRRRGRKL